VTGATTLDSTLAVAGATTLTTAAAAAEMLNIVSTHASGIPILTLKGAHSAQVRYQDENGNNQARIDFNDAGQFNFLDATDGTSHLFIKNDGNVGIGIADPDSMLHLFAGGTDTNIRIQSTATADNTSSITFDSRLADNSNKQAFLKAYRGNLSFTGDSGYGKVGIGTTTPEYELEVKASTDASINIRAGTNSGDFAGLYFGDTDYPAEGRITYQNSDNKMRFWSDRQHVMTLDDNARVGIGTESPSNLLHISSSTGDSVEMKITNTNADSIGANIHLEKDSASPADNDYCGEITWVGSNDNNQQPSFGSISVQMTDVSDGTEDGDMIFKTSSAGTFATRMRILSDGYTSVNNDGAVDSGRAGLHVEHGGLLINGTSASGTDAIGSSSHHPNYWTFIGSGGRSGGLSGSFRIEVPEPTGSSTNNAYGGFSVEIYLAGYSGAFCHAMVSGYNNSGITISESAILRSGGSHSLSYGVLSGTTQGIYVDIDIPGYTHSSAYYRITKGGDTSSNHDTDFRNLKAIFT